jgi:hypothetical protein
MPFHFNGLVEDAAQSHEALLPKPVAQNCDPVLTHLAFRLYEGSPEQSRHFERLKQVGRGDNSLHSLRISLSREIGGIPAKRRELVKRSCLLLPIEEIRR